MVARVCGAIREGADAVGAVRTRRRRTARAARAWRRWSIRSSTDATRSPTTRQQFVDAVPCARASSSAPRVATPTRRTGAASNRRLRRSLVAVGVVLAARARRPRSDRGHATQPRRRLARREALVTIARRVARWRSAARQRDVAALLGSRGGRTCRPGRPLAVGPARHVHQRSWLPRLRRLRRRRPVGGRRRRARHQHGVSWA